jgi:hypothetical protein
MLLQGTGFTDAEGCFSVILSKRPNLKWRIMVSFEINLHLKDISILHSIRDFFGVGTVYSSPNRSLCVYRVSKIDDLINVIIPHFLNYPLLTQKYSDFVLWSKVVNIISDLGPPLGGQRYVKDHLTTAYLGPREARPRSVLIPRPEAPTCSWGVFVYCLGNKQKNDNRLSFFRAVNNDILPPASNRDRSRLLTLSAC